MSDYKPGQVAVATVRGVPNVRVMRSATGWWSEGYVKDFGYHGIGLVTDVRPLVVLDPSALRGKMTAAPSAEELPHWFRQAANANKHGDMTLGSQALRLIADQIEAQTRPAIEEPGLWGVVATGYDDGSSVDYWTHGPGGWFNERGDLVEWGSIKSPTLIRKGANDE